MVSEPPGATVKELEHAYAPVAELVNVIVPTLVQDISPDAQFSMMNTSVVVDAVLPNAWLPVQFTGMVAVFPLCGT
jgi:hypothetical protein